MFSKTLPLKDSYLSANMDMYGMIIGFNYTPQVGKLFENFRIDYPDSEYAATVQTQIDKHDKLQEGEDAGDFTATNINGQSFISKNRAPKGIHVNHKIMNKGPNIYEMYLISGIPHYVVIDRNGKIKANRG